MTNVKKYSSYVTKTYKYMKRVYIEQGYFNSGSIDMNDIYQNIHPNKEIAEIIVDQLLESGNVQIRRNCLGLAFELVEEERAKLIRSHDLCEKWSESEMTSSLTEDYGEIYFITKKVKKKRKSIHKYNHSLAV